MSKRVTWFARLCFGAVLSVTACGARTGMEISDEATSGGSAGAALSQGGSLGNASSGGAPATGGGAGLANVSGASGSASAAGFAGATGGAGASPSGGAGGDTGSAGLNEAGCGVNEAGCAGAAMTAPPLATAVAVGAFTSCARFDDGSMKCWGTRRYIGSGQDQTIGDDETPAATPNVDIGGAVQQLSASWYTTCALLGAGNVRCFGNGLAGNLGYGNTLNIGDDEPPAVAGDVNVGGKVHQIAVGPDHTCACLDDGKVRCWGRNDEWQLGYPSKATVGDDETPASAGDVQVGGFVVQVTAGVSHSCALLADGRVRCWGRGDDGRLGYANQNTIGDDEPPAAAGDVDLGGKAIQIAAGSYHNCALLETGKVRCWGRGYDGRLGYGNTQGIGDDETPASAGDVPVGGQVLQLSAGNTATCALLMGGHVRCWGDGAQGELGYGNSNTIGDDETPASVGDVPLGGIATHVEVGFLHACATLTTGAVRCWGRGSTGALGYGNTRDIGDDETPASAGDVQTH